MALTGADLLVLELKRQGVAWVSTLCGNGLNPFYVACRKAGVRLIDTHNLSSPITKPPSIAYVRA